MMERLAIQWAVLISSHSQLINEPHSHTQPNRSWSINQPTHHLTMGSHFRYIKAHTGTDQPPMIIPINHLTFPYLSLFSHTLLFPPIFCSHRRSGGFSRHCSHPCFSPYHSDGSYLCSGTVHTHAFPYWLTSSYFGLSYLSLPHARVVCAQCPALHSFPYIVVAYCLYFP